MRHSSVNLLLACTLASGTACSSPEPAALPQQEELGSISELLAGSAAGTPSARRAFELLNRLDLAVEPLINQNPAAGESLSDYETFLPNSALRSIPRFERALLNAYLDDPSSVELAKVLGAYHLHEAHQLSPRATPKQLQHAIFALYFLSRAVDLGARERWVTQAATTTEARLDALGKPRLQPMVEENLPSHLYFIDAFNYHEANRYIAIDNLLGDYLRQPNNLMTNAYLAASNIWAGGEAAYNDSAMLYSFLLSSYFVVRAVHMAETVEAAWLQNPSGTTHFRLGSILGGWAIPARRWLSSLHGDTAALRSLDGEHRYWLDINRAFHSASIGLMMFDEPENFMEGFGAWMAGFEHCEQVPELRSCIDRPKMSFNRLAFSVGGADYFLKAGQLDWARYFLSVRLDPTLGFGWEQWDLGRAAWEHRENNFTAIAALYANGDPSDDPTNFLLKSHKWGPNTITCQTCHQTQGRVWPAEVVEQYRYEPAHPDVAVIGSWPDITTSWYGAIRPQ